MLGSVQASETMQAFEAGIADADLGIGKTFMTYRSQLLRFQLPHLFMALPIGSRDLDLHASPVKPVAFNFTPQKQPCPKVTSPEIKRQDEDQSEVIYAPILKPNVVTPAALTYPNSKQMSREQLVSQQASNGTSTFNQYLQSTAPFEQSSRTRFEEQRDKVMKSLSGFSKIADQADRT